MNEPPVTSESASRWIVVTRGKARRLLGGGEARAALELACTDPHQYVREAAESRGSYQVTASLPVDVMGLYVLLPDAGVATNAMGA